MDIIKIRQSKEFESFKKKVNINNEIWFESLCFKKQLDVFYKWKLEKHYNVTKVTEFRRIRYLGRVKIYPPILKHFIRDIKTKNYFKPDQDALRNKKLEVIFRK